MDFDVLYEEKTCRYNLLYNPLIFVSKLIFLA